MTKETELMYKNILIPTDGSNCSEQAIKEGLKLARAFNAKVTFLCVAESPHPAIYASLEGVSYHSSLLEDLRKFALKTLEEAEVLAKESDVDYTVKLVEDSTPVKVILEEESGHDLIVLGSHGRKGFDRFLLGSVTESVLRKSQKPHLVVRCSENSI